MVRVQVTPEHAISRIKLMAGSHIKAMVICAEPGINTELVAYAIHALSPRHAYPFAAFHAVTRPEAIVDQQLFGRAGSPAPGLCRMADGGTLFIEKIEDLPLFCQSKLLGAIEEGDYRRTGAIRHTQVDLCVVAASSRSVEEWRKAGQIHTGLYWRLKGNHIVLPPLREWSSEMLSFFFSRQCRLNSRKL